jgi:stage III sporulation protein AG
MRFINEMFKRIKKYADTGNRKKLIENSVAVIIIGVILIIAGGAFFSDEDKDSGKEKVPAGTMLEIADAAAAADTGHDYDKFEIRLERILSSIEGAGKVNVMITYVSGSELVPAFNSSKSGNDTSEKDSEGGIRELREEEYESSIAYIEEQGTKKPIIIRELKPVVKGVVVVCDGAGDPVVKDNIARAVQSLTGVSIHKIQVLKRAS